tara:strand:+ start:180 stop:647 length:468 start_codon:yes stop_codon:yes gene_type:complete
MSLMVNDVFRNKAKRSPEQVQALANTIGEINEITEPLESAVWLFEKIAYLVASAKPEENIPQIVAEDLEGRGYDVNFVLYPRNHRNKKTVEKIDINEIECDVYFRITEGKHGVEFVCGTPVIDYQQHKRQESFSVKVKTGGIILLYKSFTREGSV